MRPKLSFICACIFVSLLPSKIIHQSEKVSLLNNETNSNVFKFSVKFASVLKPRELGKRTIYYSKD